MHSEIFYEKKTNLTLENMITSIYARKKHTLWQKFLLHFRTPKGILKNMPFGVPAHTYTEELQPCPTGLFQGKERYPKY